jgi:hypothetical protein
MSRTLICTLLACAWLCLPEAGRGEIFLLSNGGKVEGTWLNASDKTPESYEIETPSGGRITLSASQVEEVIVKSDVLKRYEEFLPKVANTAEGHWDMAERCRKAGLKPQRELHMRKVLEFEPNHVGARRGLGYSQVDGRWIKMDEWLQAQGYIRHGGSWKLPQEIELDTREERREVEEKEWRTRVRRWRSWAVKGGDRGGEGLTNLRKIDEPLAARPLAELLDETDELPQLKFLYMEVLGRFRGLTSTNAFIRRVMTDPDIEVRERAIDHLKHRGAAEAVTVLINSLKSKKNAVVNRAAWGLGELNDATAIPALIEALTTKHKFLASPGGGNGNYNLGFSPTSGNSFSTGGGPKMVEREIENQAVLTALTKITPEGVNFGLDKRAWRNWYANVRNGDGKNLRRGD